MLDALRVACLASCDDDALVYVNAAFEEMTGWTADEALGRPLGGRADAPRRRRRSPCDG